MNLNDLTVLTVSFNNNVLTGMMLKSLHKQLGYLPNVVIVDNGDKKPVDDNMRTCFTVIDNFQHKLLEDERQPSRNHAAAIDYALKNVIKTDWVLLVDNDVLFKPAVKTYLENFNETEYDYSGTIGWDCTPPNRLFPYFCLINVKKFRDEKRNYFDRERTICLGMPGKSNGKKYNYFDTGYSFYEDVKTTWRLLNYDFNDACIHLKSGMLANKNIYDWLNKHKSLIK